MNKTYKSSKRKNNKKQVKRTKQKGGELKTFHDPIKFKSMPGMSTSGHIDHTIDDIVGLVESAVDTTVDVVNLIAEAIRVPMDLGKAWSGPADPSPYNVSNPLV